MSCTDITEPRVLAHSVICVSLGSLAEQVSGAGAGVAGLFRWGVLQFCFKMLGRKCKKFLWFIFCSHIRVREEGMLL